MKKSEIKKVNIQGIDITKNIKLDNNDLVNNTYMRITYMNKQFKICSRQYIKQKKITYKCVFYRTQLKDEIKPYTYCKATIIAIRKENNIKDFLFYIKENHSKLCDSKYENIILEDKEKFKDNTNLKNETIKNNIPIKNKKHIESNIDKHNNKVHINNKLTSSSETNNNNKEKINETDSKNTLNSNPLNINKDIINIIDNINNLEDFDKYLKSYFIENKDKKLKAKNFIDYVKALYNNKKYKLYLKFKMAQYHLKNLYYKYVNILLPKSLSDIYSYANSFEDIGPLARAYEVKNIVNEDKKYLEHQHIIFYTDYHFKRLFSSEHILMDCTYVYPPGFSQTMIIMYYDIIVYKFIPGIFILTNNKTLNGYKHIFNDLYENLTNYEKETNNKLHWNSYTSDFEIALISAFNEVFLSRKTNITHYGCYFHFLKNCRKKLVKEGFGTKDNEAYDTAIQFTSSLPFKKNIEKNYNSIINKFFQKKKIYIFIENI